MLIYASSYVTDAGSINQNINYVIVALDCIPWKDAGINTLSLQNHVIPTYLYIGARYKNGAVLVSVSIVLIAFVSYLACALFKVVFIPVIW